MFHLHPPAMLPEKVALMPLTAADPSLNRIIGLQCINITILRAHISSESPSPAAKAFITMTRTSPGRRIQPDNDVADPQGTDYRALGK